MLYFCTKQTECSIEAVISLKPWGLETSFWEFRTCYYCYCYFYTWEMCRLTYRFSNISGNDFLYRALKAVLSTLNRNNFEAKLHNQVSTETRTAQSRNLRRIQTQTCWRFEKNLIKLNLESWSHVVQILICSVLRPFQFEDLYWVRVSILETSNKTKKIYQTNKSKRGEHIWCSTKLQDFLEMSSWKKTIKF